MSSGTLKPGFMNPGPVNASPVGSGNGDGPDKAGRANPASVKAAGPQTGVVTPLRPKRKCPECGRPSDRATFPFCSPRCKSVDLNRWLSGAYVIAGRDDDISTPSDEDEG